MQERAHLAESIAAAAAAKSKMNVHEGSFEKVQNSSISHLKESIDEYEEDLSSHLTGVLSSIQKDVDPVIRRRTKYW